MTNNVFSIILEKDININISNYIIDNELLYNTKK